ncbi:hypothetical protein [Polymorphobacter megasporae]|uniref:hypothetical protein n=1 Tax=Glacieibacterium megasporae TaxID=2835787 RepID=UPI001C1E4525|nr:hypothetical protein [Polymorphobacter megasporae]UAJ11300.1 hypothetical protein KTC28_06265 [Polymorphobacter megasporae]
MTVSITLERFAALADAYGGVVARWPESERAAAMQIAAEPEAGVILASALELDEALDAWTVPAASTALRERVLGSAPAPSRDLVRRARLWWSGVGIAAALAGAAAGTAAVAIMPPIDASGGATSFGDVGRQES